MVLRFSPAALAGLLALSSCFENENIVGSALGVGGETPIHVGGANTFGGSGGVASGGSGNAPGNGGGSGGATASATCRATGQQITLAKACQTADDCVLIRDSGAVSLTGGNPGPCTTLVIGISQAEEARFADFSSRANCPPPVGCGLGEPMQQTEDGNVRPLSAEASVQCSGGACRSYAP